MTRAKQRRRRLALCTALLGVAPSTALGHAAVARSVAIAPEGEAIALRVPGFGVVIRADAERGFAYACDALMNVAPSDLAPPLAFTAKDTTATVDTLLVGTPSGLRHLSLDGCPRAGEGGALRGWLVLALGVHPRSRNVVYTAAERGSVRVARSEDGGRTWELRATLPTTEPVSALVLDDENEDAVYVSQGGRMLVSGDAAGTFSAFVQEKPRRLLALRGRRLWAVGQSESFAGNRGFELLTAPDAAGPWATVLSLNFFGGFALEPDGAVWAGDEGGGVYRAANGDAPFENVAPATAVVDLGYGRGALWAGTPGLSTQRALARWSEDAQTFEDVVALAGVDRLPECAEVDATATCAAAWGEWKRDVLLQVPPAEGDASAPPGDPDGGASSESPRERPSGGCAMSSRGTARENRRPSAPVGAAVLFGAVLRLRERKPNRQVNGRPARVFPH